MTQAGRYGLTMFGISTVDIALWDIAGKRVGKPLFEMLGGRQIIASLLKS